MTLACSPGMCEAGDILMQGGVEVGEILVPHLGVDVQYRHQHDATLLTVLVQLQQGTEKWRRNQHGDTIFEKDT